jgi:hypothetical protein
LSVTKVNVFVAHAVVIASIIRIYQLPPIGEIDFIKILVGYQFLLLLGSGLAIYLFQQYRNRDAILFSCYGFVCLILMVIIIYEDGVRASDALMLKQLTQCCVSELGFPKTIINFNHISLKSVAIGAGGTFGGIVIFSLIFSLNMIYFGGQFRPLVQALHLTSKHRLFTIAAMIGMFYWTSCEVYLLVFLGLQRVQLRKATGALYQDSQFSFGQVMAVLAWAPVLHDLALTAYGMWYLFRAKLRSN